MKIDFHKKKKEENIGYSQTRRSYETKLKLVHGKKR